MTDLRTRTAEMLAYESNPSRDQWRKLVTELLQDALRYQWLRDQSCSHEVCCLALDDDVIDEAMEKNR